MATKKKSKPQGAKEKILASHTDEGLDAARTERVVDTSLRVADADPR